MFVITKLTAKIAKIAKILFSFALFACFAVRKNMQPFTPRPSQEEILRYTGGRLGIAAVPGAGKTHILSALAAQIIQSGALLTTPLRIVWAT